MNIKHHTVTEDFRTASLVEELMRNGYLNLALLQAAQHGLNGIVYQLIEQEGVDIETENRKDGATALHLAAYYNQDKTVRALLELGANVDALDDEGCKPLDRAHQTHANRTAREIEAFIARHPA